MTRLEPLPAESIADVALLDAFESSANRGLPGEWLVRLVARVPNQGTALIRLLDSIDRQRGIPLKTKFMVGVLLAQMAGDGYSPLTYRQAAEHSGIDPNELDRALGDYDDDEDVTPAERIALEFAEQMFLDATKIDDQFFDQLREWYSHAQIMELGTFCGVRYALSVLLAVLEPPITSYRADHKGS